MTHLSFDTLKYPANNIVNHLSIKYKQTEIDTKNDQNQVETLGDMTDLCMYIITENLRNRYFIFCLTS